jgi:uncharacterized protein
MSLELVFSWDPVKATANFGKHRVSFAEARAAFQDPLALSIEDRHHDDLEPRRLLLGESKSGRLLTIVYAEREDEIRLISARLATARERRMYEGGDLVAEMEAEYDFTGGVRGKYAERYAAGTNVVLLDRDVFRYFRDSEAVNRALRSLIPLIDEARASVTKKKPIRKAQGGA